MKAEGRKVFRYEQLLSDCCTMSSLSWARCFIWVFLHTSITDGIKTMRNPEECIFHDPHSGKKYNITTLRNGDGLTPRFQTSKHPLQPGVGYKYSFNPCVSFPLGPKKETEEADCQLDVAICMWLEGQAYHKIAEQSKVKFGFYGKIPALFYTGDHFIYKTVVLLKCNETKVAPEQASFDIWNVQDRKGFLFNLTHKCACPDACLISPSEHTTKDPTATTAPSDSTNTVVEIAVPAGTVVLILVLIVMWLLRKGKGNDPYVIIEGENGGAVVDHSNNEFPDTSDGTSGRGSASVTRLSPMGSSCSDITVPNKTKKDNLNSKIKTYTEALC